jgi:hypothetical protein
MKTAMQELITELKRVEDYPMMPFVIKIANDLIEKEKEQIIEAHAFGADDVDSNGGLLLRGVKNAIYYYNQTYNNERRV